MCIATELLGINLYELIKLNKFKRLPVKLVRHFARQLLEGLRFLDHKEIIHCDLKPENILLSDPDRGFIKIIDFGSSCYESEKVYTYIQSRFYRSPEVILGMVYNQRIDMWSLGCIVAELLTGHPLFMGENEQEQIACIMEIFGVPEKSMISQCSRRKLFFDSVGNPRIHVSSKNVKRYPGTKSLKKVLKTNNDVMTDFISKCLIWNPRNRLVPFHGLHHEFITGSPDYGNIATRKASYSSLSSMSSANLSVIEAVNSVNSVKSYTSNSSGYYKATQPYSINANNGLSQKPHAAKEQARPLPHIPASTANAKIGSSGRRESAPLSIPRASGEPTRNLSNGSKYGALQHHPSGPRPLQLPSSSIEAVAAQRSMSGGAYAFKNQGTAGSGQFENDSNRSFSSSMHNMAHPPAPPPHTLKTTLEKSVSNSSGTGP